MTKSLKTSLSLLLVILILFLAVYSVLKYNKEENQRSHSSIFYSAEKGENIIFSFLYSIADFNWFKSDRKILEEKQEIVYEEVKEINMSKEKIKNIDLFQLIKKSINFNNWSVLWANYWQEQSGWFDKELRDIVK